MFSVKNFSLKKWAWLTLFLFIFTFTIAYLLQITGETRDELVTRSALIRRLVAALLAGLIISFMQTKRKS